MKNMTDGVDWKVLKWLGYVERRIGERLNQTVYESEMQKGVHSEDTWAERCEGDVWMYKMWLRVPLTRNNKEV